MKENLIEKLFNEYKTIKQDKKKGIPHLYKIKTKKIKDRNGNKLSVVSNYKINKFNPDNININFFWEQVTKNFLEQAIAPGGNAENIKELNEYSVDKIHKAFKTLREIDRLFEKKENPKILEIGPGTGSVLQYIIENYNPENYYAVDVVKLFKWKNLFIEDGKTIPKQIPNNLDMVYSVNVFQHLSVTQRKEYYKQIVEKLKKGGVFIFQMFVVNKKNEFLALRDKRRLFGIVDQKGRYYCSFFNQLTQVETLEEIKKEFQKYDVKLNIILEHLNATVFKITKL